MKVMVVGEGEGELFFFCQALKALGAELIHAATLDEDKVVLHRVDMVVHRWSSFNADVQTVQIQNLKEADPNLVIVLFAPTQDVGAVRHRFPRELVADTRALEAAHAERTARAALQEARARRGMPPVPVAAA
ncbi:MAG: hypothetical protein GX774_19945 [Armatimonadetes bacterium]|jgi:hypothetical protein|nr:hypothetical protein [Armatimonadota bacterium]